MLASNFTVPPPSARAHHPWAAILVWQAETAVGYEHPTFYTRSPTPPIPSPGVNVRVRSRDTAVRTSMAIC